jgi:hypothetical protein
VARGDILAAILGSVLFANSFPRGSGYSPRGSGGILLTMAVESMIPEAFDGTPLFRLSSGTIAVLWVCNDYRSLRSGVGLPTDLGREKPTRRPTSCWRPTSSDSLETPAIRTIYRILLNNPGYVTTSPWTSMSISRTKSLSNDS